MSSVLPCSTTASAPLYSKLHRYLAVPSRRSAALVKRVLDMFGVLIVLPAAILIAVPVMVLLWWQDRTVFYSQMRIGKGGVPFRLWKFQTMRGDPNATLDIYLAKNPQAADEWAHKGKLCDDPRIRVGGHFLRRMSIDELPQLWNIARGEMSFVGPRPVLQSELDQVYGSAAEAYMSCTPGLSGLWQVSGRNALTYQQRVALDCHYAQHKSFALDLWILGRTVGTVLRGSGC